MRNTLFVLIILSTIKYTSCQKKCDCSENWDSNITYVKNDLVKKVPVYASEDIDKVNVFKSLFMSLNYLIWGDV